MKKTTPLWLTVILVLLFSLSLILLSSCSEVSIVGDLALDFSDDTTKSILPGSINVSWIQISGTRNDDPSIFFSPQNFTLGSPLKITDLSVGTWTINVVGYGGNPSEGFPALTSIATDSNVVIQSGKTTTATFSLQYLSSGIGSCNLTIVWPETLSSFSKVEAVLNDTRLEGTMTGSSATITGDLAVGDYLVDIVFTNPLGTQISFPYMEMVNVYNTLTSTGTITLVEADFSQATVPTIANIDVTGGQQISLSSATNDSTIYYTTDGTDPTTSGTKAQYTGPFNVSETKTVRAVAVKTNMTNSAVATKSVTVGQVATPTISPAGGLFSVSQQVTMSCATNSAVIHYTTDGTAPTASSPTYNGALTLNSTATVKAIAVKSGMVDSLSSSQSYTLMGTVATPTITNTDATGGQQVSITSTTSGATIYYTLDGSTPTTSSSTYGSPFKLTATKTVKAIAVKTDMTNSAVATKSVTVGQVATPTISPAGGLFSVSQQVTMSCATDSAVIHYTTDGTAPTASSPTYNGALTLNSTATVKAIAVKSGMVDSLSSSQSYTLMGTVATPTITNTDATGGQQVSITSTTTGATIYYTLDGNTPTTSSSTYGSPFKLTATKTVKAIAVKTNMTNSAVATKSVTVGQVATPTISPAGGLFSVSQQVTMSCATDSAVIHYTTDGTAPTASSPTYNGALTLNSTATVKAIAVKSGMVDSLSSSQSYTLMGTVATPTITNTDATGGQQVSITSTTTGATIYYTLDGNTPTTSSSTYGSPFKLTATKTVKAIAVKTNMTNSAVATKSVTVGQVATPTISPAGGLFSVSQQVTMSCATNSVVIHYTTDGTAPTASSPTYNGALTLNSTATVKAIAVKSGMVDSLSSSQSYTLMGTVATPTITNTDATGGQQVSITSTTTGATIYYTLDGNTPTTSSSTYGSPFKLTATKTVKAIAVKTNMTNSAVATKSVTVGQVATPTIANADTIGGQQVTLSCATSSSAIYYTIDGTMPTISSTLYTASFKLTSPKTVKALAIKTGMVNSAVATKSVTVGQVAAPTISNTDVIGGQQVSITSATTGATIYYTIDGTAPTVSSTKYTASFKLTATKTVKALTVKTGMTNSAVATKSVTVGQVATPTISPAGGLFSVSQQVTMSCATNSAVIHYTTDGTAPTASSPTYNGALTLNSTATIKALAVKSGMVDSLSSSQSYTLMGTVATPTITNTDATGGQQVSITSTTSGATIYYTLDGNTPTTSSSTYGSPFKLTATKTVKAIAVKTNMTNSAVAIKSVTVGQVATPVITPNDEIFSGTVSITISSTSGATIYYTTDGINPTTASSTYGNPFTISATTKVKAMAVKNGMINSAIVSKLYTLQPVYRVGDTGPAGGKIFYVNPKSTIDGWRYLEAAPTTEMFLNVFGGSGTVIGKTAQGTAIGTGKKNTESIFNALGSTTIYAAMTASIKSLTYNGIVYDDWFLPSRDELALMYENNAMIGGSSSSCYWSSTESVAGDLAWVGSGFAGGEMLLYNKDVECSVRAIRSF